MTDESHIEQTNSFAVLALANEEEFIAPANRKDRNSWGRWLGQRIDA